VSLTSKQYTSHHSSRRLGENGIEGGVRKACMPLTSSTSGSSAEPVPPSGSGTSTPGARMPAPNSHTRSGRTSLMGGMARV
jgi:hypothetical protein